jgi:hypothetical protein
MCKVRQYAPKCRNKDQFPVTFWSLEKRENLSFTCRLDTLGGAVVIFLPRLTVKRFNALKKSPELGLWIASKRPSMGVNPSNWS